jgi:ligand-binding sensor domain-containing protein
MKSDPPRNSWMRQLASSFITTAVGLLSLGTITSQNASGAEQWKAVPFRTAQQKAAGWEGGEEGQMCFTLTISKKNPSYMAMGFDTAGVYLSTDGGAHWQIRRKNILSNGVQSVAFDPENPNILFAAGAKCEPLPASDPGAISPQADGIYRSTDLGLTWQRVLAATWFRSGAQNEYFVFSNLVSGVSRTIVALTHNNGLMQSTDAGVTWSKITSSPQGIWGNAILRSPNGTYWLAAEQGIWRGSTDAATWTKMGGGLPAVPVYGLALHPTDSNIVYAALGTSGVYKTTNNGANWSPINTGLPVRRWTRLARGPGATLWVDATETWERPYRTSNEGASWSAPISSQSNYYASKWYSEGMVAHPSDGSTAFSMQGLNVTHDGGATWTLTGAGISGSRRDGRTTVAFRPDDPNKMMFFHTDWGSSLTTDNGDTWTWRPGPRKPIPDAEHPDNFSQPGGAYDPTPGSKKLVSSVGDWTGNVLIRSSDDGATWQPYDRNVRHYAFFAWHPQNASVVYVGYHTNGADGGLRSLDGSNSFHPISRSIRAMFKGNGDIIYSITHILNAAGARIGSQVYRSNDRGNNWTPLGGSLPEVNDIDVDPVDPNRVYAATLDSIHVYNGSTWSKKGTANGLETNAFGGLSFHVIAADPKTPGVVYAGQRASWIGVARGVFRSKDWGQTWQNLNLNLGNDLTVWGVSVAPNGTAWLGTDHGNFKLVDTAVPSQVAAPVYSPAPGTYTGAQNVTITSATTDATIRYTTNNTTPTTTNGTIYNGPVNIAATTTLKAIAYKSGLTNSNVTTGTYTINTAPAGIVGDPGFENQTSNTVSAPWALEGRGGIDRNLNPRTSRSGLNNGWAGLQNGWNALIQRVPVAQNTNYTLTGYVQTSSTVIDGYFGVRSSNNSVLKEVKFGTMTAYTSLTVSFNSGANSSVVIFAGHLINNVGAWMHLDDVSLTAASTTTLVHGTVYRVSPKITQTSALDVLSFKTVDGDSFVGIWQYIAATNQKWKAYSVGNGYWEFEPQHEIGARLDVRGGSSLSQTDVWSWTRNGGKAQRWKPIPNSDGSLSLEPECAPGTRLDVKGGATANGTRVWIYTNNNGDAQRWFFQTP